MNKLNGLQGEESETRIRELLKELTDVKGLRINKIADHLGLEKKQHWSLYKFITKGSYPKFLEANAEKILQKLSYLLEKPDLLILEEENNGYRIPTKSSLVWIPFDLKLPVVDYNGINPPISFIQLGKEKGIVICRNTSKYNADGEFFVGQTGMAADIEPGTRIAIKRINKSDWKTDRYYVIVDASEEISICELLPGDDEKTVKFVSTKNPEGPHKAFPIERILAIFKIVDGNWIPAPIRKRVVAPNFQQQDQDSPSVDSPTS